MTSGLAMLAHWSVRQKLKRVTVSVQFSLVTSLCLRLNVRRLECKLQTIENSCEVVGRGSDISYIISLVLLMIPQ